MEFTILMGSDLINTLPKWREAEEIIARYDIYVYPRPNIPMAFSTDRTTFLADAPQCAYSSTEVRDRLERGDDVSQMIDKEVREYIRSRGLWTLGSKITSLTVAISQSPERAELYLERGKCYFRKNEWGSAINDFRKAEELAEDKTEARQYIEMAEEILEYRYKDIYNP
jgi:nicotinate-nucleotide adenylyltransferase